MGATVNRSPDAESEPRDGVERVAVDLGGSRCRVALVRGAHVVERREVATPAQAGPEAVVAALAALITTWPQYRSGVHVAATGRVHEGRVTAVNRATLPGWDAFPLAASLSERLAAPVTVLNDAQAAAWGEYVHGAGRGTRDFAFVTVSTGVGAGLIASGALLRGARGLAGHLGFVAVPGSEPSYLEAVASGRAIASRGSAVSGRSLTTAEVFANAAAGDAGAAAVIAAAIDELADALVTLRWLLDPQRVAIGGSVGLAPGYLERLVRALAQRQDGEPLHLVPAALAADAGLVGAAAWTPDT